MDVQLKYYKMQGTAMFNNKNNLFLIDVFPLNFHFIIPVKINQITVTV